MSKWSFGYYLDKRMYLEAVSSTQVKNIAQKVASILSASHPILKVSLVRNVFTTPSIVKINITTGADDNVLGANDKDFYRHDVVFRNYKAAFGHLADDLTDAEIIRFDFPNYYWFMLLLGETRDGRKGVHMAFKPEISSSKLISQVGNLMKEMGYVVFPNKTMEPISDHHFLDELVRIFRASSGLSYHIGVWVNIRKQFDELKKKYPQEYQQYLQSKKEFYGKGVNAIRKMDNIRSLVLVDTNKSMPISQIKPGTKVYYPLNHPSAKVYFSQWSDDDDKFPEDEDTLAHKHAIPSQGSQVFTAFIPTERIILGHRFMPAGASLLQFEKELIVEHDISDVEAKTYDHGLICTLAENSDYEG